jgi:hypothetical protein
MCLECCVIRHSSSTRVQFVADEIRFTSMERHHIEVACRDDVGTFIQQEAHNAQKDTRPATVGRLALTGLQATAQAHEFAHHVIRSNFLLVLPRALRPESMSSVHEVRRGCPGSLVASFPPTQRPGMGDQTAMGCRASFGIALSSSVRRSSSWTAPSLKASSSDLYPLPAAPISVAFMFAPFEVIR